MRFEVRGANEEGRRARGRRLSLLHSSFEPRTSNLSLPFLTALALLAIWSTAVHLTATKIFPSPVAVGKGIAQLAQTGRLWSYTIDSLARVAAGYLSAIAVGIPLGFLLGWYA